MPKANASFLTFNRGVISPKLLARVDIERTRLSAAELRNWLPKTQGAITVRPGTKHFGSSINDTGAQWLEFVASTDDVALLEMSSGKMRVWLGEDAHELALLARPKVDTTVSLSDTGWTNGSTGGVAATAPSADLIPVMTAATTMGVAITASSEDVTADTPTLAFRTSATSEFSNQVSVPASVVAGDILVLYDVAQDSTTPSSAVPSGFTTIVNNSVLHIDEGGNVGQRVIHSFKVADGTEASTLLTGMNASTVKKTLEVFSTGLTTPSVAAVDTASQLTDGNPSAQVVNANSGVAPLIVLASYYSTSDIDPRSFTPSKDAEISNGTNHFFAYKIYNSSPADVTVDQDAGGFSILASYYLQVTGGGSRAAWKVADDDNSSFWADTGDGGSTLPSWLNVDFGSGNSEAASAYSLRAPSSAGRLNSMARDWRLLGGNFDTGTFATDTGKWTLTDERSNEIAWALSEKRSFSIADTGVRGPWRHWRLFTDSGNGDTELNIAEFELLPTTASSAQAYFNSGTLTLNATSIGALAKATKRVVVSDTGTEHSLAVNVQRGPVTLRVGSTAGADDYITEASLGSGRHNLAFTPLGNFHVTLQSDAIINRIVSSLAIGDSGTVELVTPWLRDSLGNIRYEQSADVVYADCVGVRPQKIERRGTGRSWSVVDYAPNNGPFLPTRSSSAKLSVSHFYGNTTLSSDIPFFQAGHVGALARLFHNGQNGQWLLGAVDAATEPIEITGLGDTGAPGFDSERRILFVISGTFGGGYTIERSIDGIDVGFKTAPSQIAAGGDTGWATDTGGGSITIDDPDDNLKVWYRVKLNAHSSGVAVVTATYGGGGVTGTARITDYQSQTAVGIEVLSRFSDTGPSDNWQMGYWSEARGFPTAVSLHQGRLSHAQGATLFMSVSDDFENFDETTLGDAGPIIRSLGSGPVDNIYYLVSLLRMVIGTAGKELLLRSTSFDEPVTPDNSSVASFSSQGSANLRAVAMDNRAIFVQRSRQRVFMVGAGQQGSTFGDYEATELTLLVPELLEAGIVSIAIQRQPDTRIHCVLADGTVAILTYEPQEEVLCWSTWETDGSVERAMVLPGVGEDAVYYHTRRTIGSTSKRFLEKWAMESECVGDTGLTWIMDCARSYTDTGRTLVLTDIAPHLAGESVVAWGSLDTGSTPHIDLSPDTGSDGSQRRWSVDTGGDVTLTGLTQGVHHAVVGLRFPAPRWKSSKLAYAAEAGTALAQPKRTDKLAMLVAQTHPRGLFFGRDTGNLDPLPRVIEGADVDQDQIIEALDLVATPFPGKWMTDPRLVIEGKSPRPATVLALIPTVQTSEKV